MFNGTGRYTLYRNSGDWYVTLTTKMVFHPQMKQESCFFAAYADIMTYRGLNNFGNSSADARDLELAILRDEIWNPDSDKSSLPDKSSRILATAYFRACLYKADSGNSGWLSPDDPNLISMLQNGRLLDKWWNYAFAWRWQAFGLEDVLKKEIPQNVGDSFQIALRDLIKKNIRDDNPLMVAIIYNGKNDLPPGGDPARSGQWLSHGHVGVALDPTPKGAHWLKITGLRFENGKYYVHFCATMEENDRNGFYFVEFDNLIQCLPRRYDEAHSDQGQMRWIKPPPGWTQGNDPVAGSAYGGYVPIIVKFGGPNADAVREDRPPTQ